MPFWRLPRCRGTSRQSRHTSRLGQIVMRLLPRLPRTLGVAFVVSTLLFVSLASGQPALSGIAPGAAGPGKTTDLVVTGAKLDQPLKVWSSYPGVAIEVAAGDPNQKGKTQLTLKVTLPADAPCGIGSLLVATSEGLSDQLYFAVDDLPSVADNGNNHTPETAQDVAIPSGVDGASDGTVSDFYKFAAKASQRLSIEVVGTRLGSNFDPVLRLRDPSGSELLLVDDDLSLGADCRLSYVFPADGSYTLELRDNRYKAGGRYRLRIGDFPLVSTAYPTGVPLGGASQIAALGPLAEGIAPIVVGASPAAIGQRVPVSVKLPGGTSSGFAVAVASDLPEFVENAASGQPTLIQIPGAVSGRLEAEKNVDSYQFAASKGTRITAKAFSRSLHSPAVVAMKLYNASGAAIGESPVTESEEEALSVVIPETGIYKLTAEDLLGRGGPEFTYRLELRTGNSFALNIKPDQAAKMRLALSKRDAFTIAVQAVRNGYDGPITLGIDAPHPGWQVYNNVIPARAAEVAMYVVAPPDLTDAEIVPLRIVGSALIDGASRQAAASTTAILKAARPFVAYPPAWLDGQMFVSGLPDRAPFYTVAPDKLDVPLPRIMGQGQVTLTMNRTDANFKDLPLTVIPLGLPAGVTAEIKRNGNGPQETYDVVLKGPANLMDGQRLFKLFTYAELAGRGQAVLSRDLALNVFTPLSVAIAPAGPLVVGQKQKVKVTLTRTGDPQPLDVAFKKLPAGVTVSKVTVLPNPSELEIELAAAADAAQGVFAELAVTATTKYAGVDISVDSPNVNLEVKAP